MRHEVEVDTALAALWEREAEATENVSRAVERIHEALGERRERRRDWTYGPWPTTTGEVIDAARAAAADPVGDQPWPDKYEATFWDAKGRTIKAREALDRYDKAVAEARAIRAESRPLEEEYNRARWSRFFLVTNANGHIHSSLSCSTTYPTTQWQWLPSLSGLTEADAVAEQGTRLCSICYPSAPVEWTVGLPPKVNPNRCPGSGQDATDVRRGYSSLYGTCPVCNQTVAVNRTLVTRAHNHK